VTITRYAEFIVPHPDEALCYQLLR